MSANFQLTRIGEEEPSNLREVDDRMWRELGLCEPDPDQWYKNWFGSIGLGLAVGRTFRDIEEDVVDSPLAPILEWIEKNYTVKCWRGV